MPITRQKSPVFAIVSLPTDSVIVNHAVFSMHYFEQKPQIQLLRLAHIF
jgi:hypothetical protein